MPIEDEIQKIRRNLVVFCSLYLAGAFLGISFQSLIASSFLKEGMNISQNKVAVLTILLFIYLFCRWASSEDQIAQFLKIRNGYVERMFSLINEWVLIRAKERNFDGENFHFLNPQERQKFEEWLASVERTVDMTGAFEVHVGGYSGWPHKGTQILTFNAKSAPVIQINFSVIVPLWSLLLFRLRSLFSILLKQDFWEWFPPALLALLTFGVIMYRTFR